MITHYLKFMKLNLSKSKSRYDLVAYTEPIYEGINTPFIYLYSNPQYIKAKNGRTPNFAITSTKGHISSGFISDITKPNYAYGDIKNTKDLLIFNITDLEIEVFVCKDKKFLFEPVMNLLFDGELDNIIQELRGKAINKDSSKSKNVA